MNLTFSKLRFSSDAMKPIGPGGSPRLAVAVHEAAHAVANIVLGRGVDVVRLFDGSEDVEGEVVPLGMSTAPGLPSSIEVVVVTAMAGDVGERVILQRRTSGGDERQISQCLALLGGDSPSARRKYLRCARRVVRHHRSAIEAVAVALSEHGHLTGEEVVAIVAQSEVQSI